VTTLEIIFVVIAHPGFCTSCNIKPLTTFDFAHPGFRDLGRQRKDWSLSTQIMKQKREQNKSRVCKNKISNAPNFFTFSCPPSSQTMPASLP